MDRQISPQEKSQVARKRVLKTAVAIVLALAALWALRELIAPAVDSRQLRISTVTPGAITASIDVVGKVAPAQTTQISAAFGSTLTALETPIGSRVEAGQILMRLDDQAIAAQIRTLQEQIALKRHARTTAKLTHEKALHDARGRQQLLDIDLESREAKHNRLATLAKTGAISSGQALEAALDVRRTQVERKQLAQEIENLIGEYQAQLNGIDLEISIQENALAEQQRLQRLSQVTAPHSGVVTWMMQQIGESVDTGQLLARVANTDTYQIEAQVSDYHAPKLREGMLVKARITEWEKTGMVVSIAPSETTGQLQLLVQLDEPNDQRLRPQLRADLELITAVAQDTLLLDRGPGLSGSGTKEVWRIDGDTATKTRLELGLSNRRQLEVLTGAVAGDAFIISDTSEFDHLSTIHIE